MKKYMELVLYMAAICFAFSVINALNVGILDWEEELQRMARGFIFGMGMVFAGIIAVLVYRVVFSVDEKTNMPK